IGRLQLYSRQPEVTEGLIPVNHYGIKESAREITDLGESCDVLPLAMRHKAVDMSDCEAIATSYDAASPTYQRIVEKAKEGGMNGYMHGISFLLFERKTGRLLEFYCCNESARRAAKYVFPYLPLTPADIDALKAEGTDTAGMQPHGPLPITLKGDLITKGKNKWHAPVVLKCSTPFTNVPPLEKLVAAITAFLSVEDDGIEVADTTRVR